MIRSNWHIHSECSYDASLPLEIIARKAVEMGYEQIGITDHANYNDKAFIGDITRSASSVKKIRERYPFITLGVELTPIEKPEYDYIKRHGTRDGYIAPIQDKPFDIELALTKDELTSLGIRYAIGAAHWRIDVPKARSLAPDMSACIKEWFRLQMWLACDERVTVLGHPWYHCEQIWYDDFSVIPKSMNCELAAALLENGKYAECNASFFLHEKSTEKFRYQYAEFLRELFESGIKITYGSDSHHSFTDNRDKVGVYLSAAGFKDGDFSEISPSALW